MMQAIRRSPGLLIVTCAVAIAFSAAESARAGTYVIRNCNVPGQSRRPIGPWHWDLTVGVGTFGFDDCGAGGGFGIDAGMMPWASSTGVSFESPPAIAIRKMRLWLVARLRSTGGSALFAVVTSGSATMSNPAGLFNDPGGSTLATPYESPTLSPETNSYLVLVNCTGGTGAPCNPVDTAVLDIRGTETTLEESSAPSASITGGTLLAPVAVSGVRTLNYSVNDPESGVAKVEVRAGKTVVGGTDFAADCQYASWAACPMARNGSLDIDTRKVSDGIYPVSLTVTDAAGNAQTALSTTAIQVLNEAASGQVVGSEATSGARLTAAFAANRRATLTVGYGRRVVVRGRLVTAGGEPIAGAPIEAVQRYETGGAPKARDEIVTGADGGYSYEASRGPSRTITFSYGADKDRVVPLRLRVEALARLGVTLNGTLVRYRGRVLTAPLPRRGKRVEIQGRAPGAGWKTFAERRTNHRGAFSGTYRLRVHRPGVRLQFRVRVPREASYPFVAAVGRVIARVVR